MAIQKENHGFLGKRIDRMPMDEFELCGVIKGVDEMIGGSVFRWFGLLKEYTKGMYEKSSNWSPKKR